jgi:UDP-N-acetylmuramate dehydrogenase
MNAGSWGLEIGDIVSAIMIAEAQGDMTWLNKDQVDWHYRMTELPEGATVVSAVLDLQEGDPREIAARVDDYLAQRKKSQPLSHPSAGSIFKNPPHFPAGKLIDELGLKGLRQGDAMVSGVHANFIINLGSATAYDVLSLIDTVRQSVLQERKISLELEVELLGEFDLAR